MLNGIRKIDSRKEQLRAMHEVMKSSNDVSIYLEWVAGGIPDCPNENDFEVCAEDDELYMACIDLFCS